MLSFTGSLRIYVSVEPCDMHKGFEGLAGLVTTALKKDLRSGALFVFNNRRRLRLNVFYFDGTDTWLMTKRLEEGTFSCPQGEQKVIRPWRKRSRCSLTGSICAGAGCGPGMTGLRSKLPLRMR